MEEAASQLSDVYDEEQQLWRSYWILFVKYISFQESRDSGSNMNGPIFLSVCLVYPVDPQLTETHINPL